MSRNLSDGAIETAKRLYNGHLRRPDGSCKCGLPYGKSCRQDRAYGFNALRLAGVITLSTWTES